MSLLGGISSGFPNNIKFYDVSVSSYTVASATDASAGLLVTGSSRTFTINSAKNVTPLAGNNNWYLIFTNLSALQTTASTDTYTLAMEYSVDNGVTWQQPSGSTIAVFGGAGSQNKPGQNIQGFTGGVQDHLPWTGGKMLWRMAVYDATNPSTDAFTLTNIRGTVGMVLMV